MSDDQNNAPPAPAASAAPNAPLATEPADTYTRDDVEAILQADRAERAAAQPQMSAIERFKHRAGAKPAAPAAPAQPDKFAALADLMHAQLLSQMAPKVAPPPPPMTALDKVSSADPDVWLGRGRPNSFTAADRQALVDHHRGELARTGFAGDIETEATTRANRQIVSAAQRALRSVKIGPGGGSTVIVGEYITGRTR